MTNNIGSIDRVIRIIAGIVLLSLIFLVPEAPWRWVGLIGIVPLGTAAIGWCPLYSLIGMNTGGKG